MRANPILMTAILAADIWRAQFYNSLKNELALIPQVDARISGRMSDSAERCAQSDIVANARPSNGNCIRHDSYAPKCPTSSTHLSSNFEPFRTFESEGLEKRVKLLTQSIASNAVFVLF